MEMPTITAYASNAAAYSLTGGIGNNALASNYQNQFQAYDRLTQPSQTPTVIEQTQIETLTPMSNRRVVQVFIADPNESVPLDKSILFQDERPKLTDLTDQELFFEIDINSVLKKHNELRVTLDDRNTFDSSQVRKLEPAKIRDLKMTVVTVAQF